MAANPSRVFNLAIIGGGTAGLVAAAATARLGGRVVLIEAGAMGGECLNTGCVPSKALLASAHAAHAMRHAEDWGLPAASPKVDLMAVLARMREARARIAPHDSQETLEAQGVEVLRGRASFLSPHSLSVNGQTVRAANFLIATGSRPAVPDIPGLSAAAPFTNENIFDELKAAPARVLILGGGPVGCEMAQAFQRLGVEVTVVQTGKQLLPKEDADVAAFIHHRLTAGGVRVWCDAKAGEVKKNGTKSEVSLTVGGEARSVACDAILVAAGRRPNVESLDLDRAGVKLEKGRLWVNARLQTNQLHIYAAGDVVGPYRFTHMAGQQAGIVVRNVLAPVGLLRKKFDYSVVPWCTFTDPEVARVGLSEDEARRKGIPYRKFEAKLADVDRAIVENQAEGFIKILVAAKDDGILGAVVVSARAGEVIHEVVLAMKHKLGMSALAGLTHIYPTFSESIRAVTDQFRAASLTPTSKRLFGWLYGRKRRSAERKGR